MVKNKCWQKSPTKIIPEIQNAGLSSRFLCMSKRNTREKGIKENFTEEVQICKFFLEENYHPFVCLKKTKETEKSKNHIRNANLLSGNQQEMAKIEMICDSIQLKTWQDHIFGQPCPRDITDFTLLGYLSAWPAGIHWLQTLMAIWGASSPVWLGVLTNSHEKTSSRFFPERLIDNLLASHQQFTKTHINLVILSWNANKL